MDKREVTGKKRQMRIQKSQTIDDEEDGENMARAEEKEEMKADHRSTHRFSRCKTCGYIPTSAPKYTHKKTTQASVSGV